MRNFWLARHDLIKALILARCGTILMTHSRSIARELMDKVMKELHAQRPTS